MYSKNLWSGKRPFPAQIQKLNVFFVWEVGKTMNRTDCTVCQPVSLHNSLKAKRKTTEFSCWGGYSTGIPFRIRISNSQINSCWAFPSSSWDQSISSGRKNFPIVISDPKISIPPHRTPSFSLTLNSSSKSIINLKSASFSMNLYRRITPTGLLKSWITIPLIPSTMLLISSLLVAFSTPSSTENIHSKAGLLQ